MSTGVDSHIYNDGWPDIVGIRGDEPGASNGRPFIFLNNGQLAFETLSGQAFLVQQHVAVVAVGKADGDIYLEGLFRILDNLHK